MAPVDPVLRTLPQVVSVRNVWFEPVYAREDHCSGHAELLHVIHGRLELCLGGRRFPARPGDTLLTPSGAAHRDLFDTQAGLDALLVHFDWAGEAVFRAAVSNDDLLALSPECRGEAGAMLDAMRGDFGTDDVDRVVAATRLHGLLMLFLRDVLRRRGEAAVPVDAMPGARTRRLVREAKAYVDHHYARPVTLDGIAEALRVSPFYLSRVFSRESDVSLFGYLTAVRLGKARQLLREERLNVSEVAYRVGYEDPNYFSKVFRRVYGCSPSRFAARAGR